MSNGITEILIKEYQLYLDAQDRGDISAVQSCMSPSCWQLARQESKWNLRSREEIMKILSAVGALDPSPKDQTRGKVNMRALTQQEKDTLPEEVQKQAVSEGWQGLRVVLEDAALDGRLVKVNYYWRKEEGRWVQCLHDLIWVGPKNPDDENNVGSLVFGTG